MMRNWRIELLRGVAAFGIVGCHLALSPQTDMGHAIVSFCDMNVGLFAALSGFLMSMKGSWMDYVRRRLRRLLPIYVAWTVFFVLFGLCFDLAIRHGINPKWERPGFIWRVVFLGDASTHLWFLVCLLYAQFIAAALFRLLKFLPRYLWIVIGFVLVAVSMPIGGFFGRYFLRLFGFLLTGYGLSAVAEFVRIPLWTQMFVVFAAALFHLCGPSVCNAFILDWFLAVPLLVLFSTDNGAEERAALGARQALLLGETSLGVFLIHPVVTASVGLMVRRFAHAPFSVNWVLLDWIVCWGISFACSILMVRTKELKWMVT